MPVTWAERAAEVRAEYQRLRAVVSPPRWQRNAGPWLAWASTVLNLRITANSRVSGARCIMAKRWLHPDKWCTRALRLQRPVQVQVHFARDFLWQRVLLAQVAVRVFVRRELDLDALGAGSPQAGPVWQNSAAWRRAARAWAQREMWLLRDALRRARGANAQRGLRFRRRVLSGYLRGVVWGELVDPPPCAEDQAEQAAAEAAAAVAAAVAAAQLATRLSAEARRARVHSVAFLAEAIAWRWRRWRRWQRAVVDPRSPPLVEPPAQRLADPDSPWGQLDAVPVRATPSTSSTATR